MAHGPLGDSVVGVKYSQRKGSDNSFTNTNIQQDFQDTDAYEEIELEDPGDIVRTFITHSPKNAEEVSDDKDEDGKNLPDNSSANINVVLVDSPLQMSRGEWMSDENYNEYATRKTLAQGMLDIALLSSNLSQLKAMIQNNAREPYFYPILLCTLLGSICLQITAGICMIYLGSMNVNKRRNMRKAKKFNNYITAQIFLITVANIVIASLSANVDSDQARS